MINPAAHEEGYCLSRFISFWLTHPFKEEGVSCEVALKQLALAKQKICEFERKYLKQGNGVSEDCTGLGNGLDW